MDTVETETLEIQVPSRNLRRKLIIGAGVAAGIIIAVVVASAVTSSEEDAEETPDFEALPTA